jgi:hypothetical protein
MRQVYCTRNLNTNNMNEEQVIEFIQRTIMNEWKVVMMYEAQLQEPELKDDEILLDCVANAKERIEMFTIILNKFEQ